MEIGISIFTILVILVFAVLAIVFLFIVGFIVKLVYNRIAEKRYNDSQPVLTKEAKIIGKRTELSGGGESRVYTFHFVTFEFADDRERREFTIPSKEYGLLAEGDSGSLTFQGRRYHGFQRN